MPGGQTQTRIIDQFADNGTVIGPGNLDHPTISGTTFPLLPNRSLQLLNAGVSITPSGATHADTGFSIFSLALFVVLFGPGEAALSINGLPVASDQSGIFSGAPGNNVQAGAGWNVQAFGNPIMQISQGMLITGVNGTVTGVGIFGSADVLNNNAGAKSVFMSIFAIWNSVPS